MPERITELSEEDLMTSTRNQVKLIPRLMRPKLLMDHSGFAFKIPV